MSTERSMIRAHFTMRLRCQNCEHVTLRPLVSPDLEDAPSTIDELVESAWLKRQTFGCEKCDNPIATLIGVRQDFPAEDSPVPA